MVTLNGWRGCPEISEAMSLIGTARTPRRGGLKSAFEVQIG